MTIGAAEERLPQADMVPVLGFFREAFGRLGAAPGLTHDHPLHGIFLASAATPDGARFVHALNLDGLDKHVMLSDGGAPLFEGRPVMLPRRDGVMLPLDLDLGAVRVAWSTAEILDVGAGGITLRPTGEADAILLRTDREVIPSDAHVVTHRADGTLVTARKQGDGEETLAIAWSDS